MEATKNLLFIFHEKDEILYKAGIKNWSWTFLFNK